MLRENFSSQLRHAMLYKQFLQRKVMSLILNIAVQDSAVEVSVEAPAIQAATEGHNLIRKHERCAVDFPVKIFARGKAGTMGRSGDLGVGGIGVYAPLELALEA